MTKPPIHKNLSPVSSSSIAPVSETPPDGRQMRSQLSAFPSAAAKPRPKLPPAMNMRTTVGISATAAARARAPSGLLKREDTKSVKQHVARRESAADRTMSPSTPIASRPHGSNATCSSSAEVMSSKPKARYITAKNAPRHSAKTPEQMRSAEPALTAASRARPCLVQRRMSSAPLA